MGKRKTVLQVAHKSYTIEVLADIKRYYLFVNGKEYDFTPLSLDTSISNRPLKAIIDNDVIEVRFKYSLSLFHPVTVRVLVNDILIESK